MIILTLYEEKMINTVWDLVEPAHKDGLASKK